MNEHPKPSFKTPASFVTFRLSRLQNSLNAQAIAVLKAGTGLSLVEWRLIQILRMFENASLTQIAEHLQMDKGQLSRKIKAMVKKGLLQAAINEKDHRVHQLQLSEAAERLSEHMMPIMERRQELLLADVSVEDLATFYRVMDKIEAASKKRAIT